MSDLGFDVRTFSCMLIPVLSHILGAHDTTALGWGGDDKKLLLKVILKTLLRVADP